MSGRRVLTGFVLTLLLLLAAGIACADAAVPVRVAYTGSMSGDAPKVRFFLASPLEANEPFGLDGTEYSRDWLRFECDHTFYKYQQKPGSVTWMIPLSARHGDIELYLGFDDALGISTAYLNEQPLSASEPVTADLTDTLVLQVANSSLRTQLRLMFTSLMVVSVSLEDDVGRDSDTPMQLSITDPDYADSGWKTPTFTSDGVFSTRGLSSSRYPTKHPYKFSVMQNGEKHDVRIAGLRKDSDWILDSAYNDASRFRNRVGMDLWDEIYRLPWDKTLSGAVGGAPAELYLNGNYKGIFILNEKQDRKQIGLKKKEKGGTGLLLKTEDSGDLEKSPAGFVSLGISKPGAYDIEKWYNVEIKYPKPEDLNSDAWTDFYKMTRLVIRGRDAEFAAKIGDYLDLDNLARYYVLVNALGLNDNMRKNMTFVRYSGEGRFSRFQLLPWDMDAGFGRTYTSLKRNPEEPYTNRLFKRLIKGNVGGFNELLRQTWNRYRQTTFSVEHVMALFEGYIGRISVCGADQRETALYGKFTSYISDSYEYTLDFQKELAYLRSVLTERWSWCDSYFNGL